jgi:hypothetical protein
MDCLPGVVAAAGNVPVLFNSGVRLGADVVKALPLGASAVGIDRPYAYGIALGGAYGAEHVLRSILAEATRGTPPWPASRYTYSTPLAALTVLFESSAYVSPVVIVPVPCVLSPRSPPHRDADPSTADQNALWLGEHLPQFRLRRAKVASANGQRTWPVADRRAHAASECRESGGLAQRECRQTCGTP